MIRAVFFDFDGTLLDTEPDILVAYRTTFSAWGLDASRIVIGPPMAEAIRAVRPDISDEDLAAVGKEFIANYDGAGFPNTKPYEHVPEMLHALAGKGMILAIATNKRTAPTRTILTAHQLDGVFRELFTCDSDPVRKPSKTQHLINAMQAWGLAPEECVMVGDTELDIQAGKGAGCRTVGVSWGYGKNGEPARSMPDRMIHDPLELIRVVDEL